MKKFFKIVLLILSVLLAIAIIGVVLISIFVPLPTATQTTQPAVSVEQTVVAEEEGSTFNEDAQLVAAFSQYGCNGEKQFPSSKYNYPSFLASTTDVVVIDSGTGPDIRQLTIYNLRSCEKMHEDWYARFGSQEVTIQGDEVLYSVPTTKEVTKENCARYDEYMSSTGNARFNAQVSYNVKTKTRKTLSLSTECTVAQ